MIMMDYRYLFIFIHLWCITCICTPEGIAPGLWYEHRVLEKPDKQSIHILTADPSQVAITLGIADNICASTAKTTDLARKHHALAAINGGFFDFGSASKAREKLVICLDCLGYCAYKAFPIYTLYAHKKYYALSHNFTGALAWSVEDQKPIFTVIQSMMALFVNEKEYPVGEINRPHPKKPTIYTDCYDKTSSAYTTPMDEILIENNRVTQIIPDSPGNTTIPPKGYIYAIPAAYQHLTETIHIGDHVNLGVAHRYQFPVGKKLNTQDYILASTPLLIHDSKVLDSLDNLSSSFYTHRHPRSAVGMRNDGFWIFIVVDGRNKQSAGFTIIELAQFMKDLGCIGALNLDGGGSSTMVVQDHIVNTPSGREYSVVRKERFVSNAILICKK